MSSEEEAFRATIESAPDDEALHKVFADWLDEHDRPEEADWHRAWTTAEGKKAREWFVDFAGGHSKGYGGDDGPYTAEEIIGYGRDWLNSRDAAWPEYHTQWGGESLRDDMYQESTRLEFWRNWALATGVYVPSEVADDGYVFSCSC